MALDNRTKAELINEIEKLQSFISELEKRDNYKADSENLINKNEELFQQFFESKAIYCYIVSNEGRIIDVNQNALDTLGFEKADLVGKSVITTLYSPDSRQKAKKLFAHWKESGKIVNEEMTILSKSGELRTVLLNADAVKDQDGNVLHSTSIQIDITKRKITQEELKKSEERFQLAMEASNDGLYDWDLITNEIYYSPSWKSMLGYKDDELPNDFSVWETLTEPEHVQRSWKMQNDLINKKIDRFELEFKMKHKNGNWIDILSRANAIFDNQGKAVRIVGTHVDITQRKHAENELQKQSRRYQLTLESTSDGYILADEEGEIIDVNPAYSDMIGYSKDELLSMNIRDVEVKIPREEIDRRIKQLISLGTDRFETIHMHKNGHNIELDTSVSIMQIEDNFVVAAFMRDITETKKTEETLKIQSEIISNITEAVFLIRMEDGVIVYTNPEYQKLFGYDKNEIAGKHVSVVNAPTDISPEETAANILAEVVKDGKWQGEIKNIKKDGTIFWSLARISSFNHPQFGDVLISVHRDITELKNAQKEVELINQGIERSINGFDMVNEDGKLIYVNQAYIDMWGYDSADEILGTSPASHCLDPDIPNRIIKNLNEHGHYTIEFTAKRKDGSTFEVHMSAYLFHNDEGKAIYTGASIDITERRKNEEELNRLSGLLEETGEIAKIGGWEFDPESGKGTWTKEVALIHDLKPDDPTNVEKGLSFYVPESRIIIEEAINKALETATPYDIELEIISAKGIHKWVRTIGRPVVENGKVVKMTGSFQDITEKKKAEIQLYESTVFLKAIIENSAISLWISDADGTAIAANKACLKLFGAAESEVLGKYNLLNDNVIQEMGFAALVKNVFEKSEIADFIIDYNFADVAHVEVKKATHKIMRTIITPVTGIDGKVKNAIVQTIDLTELKQAEKELAAHRDNLEEQVKIRTAELNEKNEELERYNKLFIGREFRIKELKDTIKKLNKQLGK